MLLYDCVVTGGAAGRCSPADRHPPEDHARDESGIRPGEEGDHVGDLLRLGGASKRYASDELGDIVGRDVGGGVGCREGGGNRIDSDTSRCQLHRERSSQVDHCAFGGVVHGHARVAAEPGDGRDIDDAAATHEEIRQGGLGDQDDRLDVEGHDLAPASQVHRREGSRPRNPGVVDKHVNWPNLSCIAVIIIHGLGISYITI